MTIYFLDTEIDDQFLNYAEIINALPPEQRQHFYESLAHHFTCYIRSICFDNKLPDSHKVELVTWINEIHHRVASKISIMRRNVHKWSEESFASLIMDYVDKCPAIRGVINSSANSALLEIMVRHDHLSKKSA